MEILKQLSALYCICSISQLGVQLCSVLVSFFIVIDCANSYFKKCVKYFGSKLRNATSLIQDMCAILLFKFCYCFRPLIFLFNLMSYGIPVIIYAIFSFKHLRYLNSSHTSQKYKKSRKPEYTVKKINASLCTLLKRTARLCTLLKKN